MKQQHANRTRLFTCSTVLIAALLGSSQALAVGTNTLPFQRSFESLTVGSAIVDSSGNGSDGWQGTSFSASTNAAEVTTNTPPAPPNGYPLPSESHNKVMQMLGNVRAEFNTVQTPGNTNVLVDVMVQAGRLASPPPNATNGTQFAAYFNTNGQLVVRHAIYTNNFSPTLNRVWTTLSHTPVGSNDWVRLSINMNYLGSGPIFSATEHFCQIQLNGVTLTSPVAYTDVVLKNPEDSSFPFSGAGITNMWFLCADSGDTGGGYSSGSNNNFFTALEFDGFGSVDDVDIRSGDAPPPPPPPCANNYECWIESFYPGCPSCRGVGDDPDGDGASNYQEYVAGTNPNEKNSVFEVIDVQHSGTSNCVTWVGYTNSGNFTTFSVYRSTDMLSGPAGWMLIASNIQRNASGTNVWYDVAPPGTNAFYRPSLPTNAP